MISSTPSAAQLGWSHLSVLPVNHACGDTVIDCGTFGATVIDCGTFGALDNNFSLCGYVCNVRSIADDDPYFDDVLCNARRVSSSAVHSSDYYFLRHLTSQSSGASPSTASMCPTSAASAGSPCPNHASNLNTLASLESPVFATGEGTFFGAGEGACSESSVSCIRFLRRGGYTN